MAVVAGAGFQPDISVSLDPEIDRLSGTSFTRRPCTAWAWPRRQTRCDRQGGEVRPRKPVDPSRVGRCCFMEGQVAHEFGITLLAGRFDNHAATVVVQCQAPGPGQPSR